MLKFPALLVLVVAAASAFPQDQVCHVPTTTAKPPCTTAPTTGTTEAPEVSSSPTTSSTSPLPTSQVPTSPLPSSPLPTSPLPTSPLPTSPLPSSPLPTSPLPTSPLPTSPVTTIPPTESSSTPGPLSTIDPIGSCSEVPIQRHTIDCEKAGENVELVTLDFGTYYYDKRATTWCEAYNYCLGYNLVLAYPLNVTMVEQLRQTYSHVQHSWVGAQNLEELPGDWRWLDRKTVDDHLWYEVADGECGSLCLQNAVHSYPCDSNGPGFLCQVPEFCHKE